MWLSNSGKAQIKMLGSIQTCILPPIKQKGRSPKPIHRKANLKPRN
jgi:hypothetical protein